MFGGHRVYSPIELSVSVKQGPSNLTVISSFKITSVPACCHAAHFCISVTSVITVTYSNSNTIWLLESRLWAFPPTYQVNSLPRGTGTRADLSMVLIFKANGQRGLSSWVKYLCIALLWLKKKREGRKGFLSVMVSDSSCVPDLFLHRLMSGKCICILHPQAGWVSRPHILLHEKVVNWKCIINVILVRKCPFLVWFYLILNSVDIWPFLFHFFFILFWDMSFV